MITYKVHRTLKNYLCENLTIQKTHLISKVVTHYNKKNRSLKETLDEKDCNYIGENKNRNKLKSTVCER